MVNCGTAWAICSQAVVDGAVATVAYDVGDAELTVLERDRGSEQTDAPICLDVYPTCSPGSAAASTSHTNTESRTGSTASGKQKRAVLLDKTTDWARGPGAAQKKTPALSAGVSGDASRRGTPPGHAPRIATSVVVLHPGNR